MTKVVQLSDDAYRRLKMAKRAGESFSDVIVRRFPQTDLRELRRLSGENLAWWRKWHRQIDDMDRPETAG